MKHLFDETYKGHEIVFMEDDGLITVDVRVDDFDGEFLVGYTHLLSVSDARLKAVGFIDGVESCKVTV